MEQRTMDTLLETAACAATADVSRLTSPCRYRNSNRWDGRLETKQNMEPMNMEHGTRFFQQIWANPMYIPFCIHKFQIPWRIHGTGRFTYWLYHKQRSRYTMDMFDDIWVSY